VPSSTCEASRRIAAEPDIVEPEPGQLDPVVEDDEIRDEQAAIAAPHGRPPKEDDVRAEQLTVGLDALLLDCQAVGEAEAGFQHVVGDEVVVDDLTAYGLAIFLTVVQPKVRDDVGEVVVGRSRVFEFGVQDVLLPVGVAERGFAVDVNQGVDCGFLDLRSRRSALAKSQGDALAHVIRILTAELVHEIENDAVMLIRHGNQSPYNRAEHVFGHGLFPFQALGSEQFRVCHSREWPIYKPLSAMANAS
jgi:hypothetical protein